MNHFLFIFLFVTCCWSEKPTHTTFVTDLRVVSPKPTGAQFPFTAVNKRSYVKLCRFGYYRRGLVIISVRDAQWWRREGELNEINTNNAIDITVSIQTRVAVEGVVWVQRIACHFSFCFYFVLLQTRAGRRKFFVVDFMVELGQSKRAMAWAFFSNCRVWIRWWNAWRVGA